jgi:hypothetical protein
MSDGYDELLSTVESSTVHSSFIQSSPQQRHEQKDNILRQVTSTSNQQIYHQGEMDAAAAASHHRGEQGEQEDHSSHHHTSHHSSTHAHPQQTFTSPSSYAASSRPFSAAVADRSEAQTLEEQLPPMPKAGIKSFVEGQSLLSNRIVTRSISMA